MPTPEAATAAETANGGLGGAAKRVAEHAGAIARLEIELASLELKRKVTALGIGIGLAVGAGLFGLYGLGFLFATVAAAFETFLSDWLALLITTVILFSLASAFGLLALRLIRRGVPPLPEQAIEEAKLTAAVLEQRVKH